MNRQISDADLLEYAWMLDKNDIKIKYDIICWNPFDTDGKLREGMKFLKRFPKCLTTDVFQLKFFPGCPISDMAPNTPRLSSDRYEYWAIIYQMILYSDETAEMAFLLDETGKYMDNPDGIERLFLKEVNESPRHLRLRARTKLSKGSILTSVMLEVVDLTGPGVMYEDLNKVLGHALKCDVQRREIITWSHVFSSYESKEFGYRAY